MSSVPLILSQQHYSVHVQYWDCYVVPPYIHSLSVSLFLPVMNNYFHQLSIATLLKDVVCVCL